MNIHYSLTTRNLLKLSAETVVGVALFWSAQASANTTYRLTDLGNLVGYTSAHGTIQGTWASSINNVGVVTGYSWGPAGTEAFVWSQQSGIKSLGYLNPYAGPRPESRATAINDLGQSVGTSIGADGYRAVFWPTQGLIQDIGDLAGYYVSGSSYSYATGINTAGTVVGNGYSPESKHVAFIWSSTDGTKLIPTSPDISIAGTGGINDAGQFVGVASINIDVSRAFVWDTLAGLRLLDPLTPNDTYSVASAINEAGAVVGRSYDPATFSDRGFIWDDMTGIHELPPLSSDLNEMFPSAINNVGQVVGSNSKEAMTYSRAFIWTAEKGTQDLNFLIDQSDPLYRHVTLYSAMDINDRGQILANAIGNDGSHSYLLTPIPLPSAVLLMSFGLLPIFISTRKSLESS